MQCVKQHRHEMTSKDPRQPDEQQQGSARKPPPPESPSSGALSLSAVSIGPLSAPTQLNPHLPLAQVGLLQAAVFESGRARPAAPTVREMNQQLTGAQRA